MLEIYHSGNLLIQPQAKQSKMLLRFLAVGQDARVLGRVRMMNSKFSGVLFAVLWCWPPFGRKL